MKREKFEKIAAGAERLHEHHPRLYRFLLTAMAVTGYAYICIFLLVFLAVFGLLLTAVFSGKANGGVFRLLIFFGILSWLVLRALWIRVTPPTGIRLKSHEVPRLAEMTDNICRQLGAPDVSEVILDGTFNAGVMQVPRFGLFGFYTNYLVIGLPLLEALSPEQFRAVLAHEFGHLSGSHGKFSMWIYRINQTWQQVLNNFAQHRGLAIYLFLPFYKFLVPRFTAFAGVQNRLHEFEADRLAAQLTGREHLANALVRIHFYDELLDEKFWPAVYKLAETDAAVPPAFAKVADFCSSFDDRGTAEFMVRRAFAQTHDGTDSHPGLQARVAAIEPQKEMTPERMEQFVRMCLVKGISAAQVCLGDQRETLTARLDQMWQEMTQGRWSECHEHMEKQRQQLAELEAACGQEPENAKLMELAALTETVHGPHKALPIFQKAAEAAPDNMQAVFAVGRILLDQKDASGQALIEQVMQRVTSSRPAGCQVLAKYYFDLGDMEKARAWRFKSYDEHETFAAAEQERSTLSSRTKFLPHGLDDTVLEKIRQQLASIDMPIRVCLAQKVTKRMSGDEPCYMLVAHRIIRSWSMADSPGAAKKNQLLLEQLTKQVVTNLNLYMYVEQSPSIYKKMAKIKGAKIYTSGKR